MESQSTELSGNCFIRPTEARRRLAGERRQRTPVDSDEVAWKQSNLGVGFFGDLSRVVRRYWEHGRGWLGEVQSGAQKFVCGLRETPGDGAADEFEWWPLARELEIRAGLQQWRSHSCLREDGPGGTDQGFCGTQYTPLGYSELEELVAEAFGVRDERQETSASPAPSPAVARHLQLVTRLLWVTLHAGERDNRHEQRRMGIRDQGSGPGK